MSSGSAEALAGSPPPPGWSRVGPWERHIRWGHWTEQPGHLRLLVFSLFPPSCLTPPPFPRLSHQHVSLLFIYMSNCINKYTSSSFLTLLTVVTVIIHLFFESQFIP